MCISDKNPTTTVTVPAATKHEPAVRHSSLFSIKQAGEDTTALIQEIHSVVEQHLPGSLPSAVVLEKVSKAIEARGLTAKNTLYAQSVCPDEINHEPGECFSVVQMKDCPLKYDDLHASPSLFVLPFDPR